MAGEARGGLAALTPPPPTSARLQALLARPWGGAVLAFVAGLALLPFLVHPWFHASWDGVYYLLGARSLAHGQGYTASGVPIIVRPPGLSLFLAPFVLGKNLNFLLLNTVMGVVGLTGAVLLFAQARQRLGAVLSLSAAVVIWLNPLYQEFSNKTMSDVPGIAFLAAILLVERAATASPSRRRDLALGLLIGAGCLVRSNTLLVLPALLASRFLRWRLDREREPLGEFLRSRVALLAAVVLLSGLPWLFWSRTHRPAPPADQTMNYNYSVAMWHLDRGDPASPLVSAAEILHRPKVRLPQLLWTLHTRLRTARPGARGPAGPWFGVVLLAALFIQLLRRREPAEIFTILYTIVVVFYFSYLERIALPIYAFSLLALVGLLRDATRSLAGRAAGLAVPLAFLSLLFVLDFKPHARWPQIEQSDRERAAKARVYAQCLPPDARVATWRLGNEYSALLDRPFFVLYFSHVRTPTAAALERTIEAYGIDTVILEPETPADVRRHFSGYPRVAACAGEPVFRVRP